MGTSDPGLRAIRADGHEHASPRAGAGEPGLLHGTCGLAERLLELPAEVLGG